MQLLINNNNKCFIEIVKFWNKKIYFSIYIFNELIKLFFMNYIRLILVFRIPNLTVVYKT